VDGTDRNPNAAPSSPAVATPPRSWIAGLDGVRALAFVMVFFVHLPPPFVPDPKGGYAGVDLFFVLSGFLITDILVRELRDGGTIDFRRFFGRRAARLFPVVIMFVALIFVVTKVDGAFWGDVDGANNNIRRQGLFSLTYVYNWIAIAGINGGDDLFFVGPLWSLSVEEQFYVIWPLLLAGFGWLWRRRGVGISRSLVWVAIGGIVASNVVRFVFGVALENDTSYERALWGTDVNAGALLIGALLAIVRLNEPGWYQRFRRVLPVLIWPAIGVIAVTMFALPSRPSVMPFAGGLLAFHLAAVVFIAAIIERTIPWLNWPFELRPVRWVGKISYGAYVFHSFIVDRFQKSVRYPTPTILIASLAVAAVSFYLFEKPVGRIIRARFGFDGPPRKAGLEDPSLRRSPA
jgi:peptidoglycan/LPS O-acetylase OafA/YrhL